jgi:hypothetical protein
LTGIFRSQIGLLLAVYAGALGWQAWRVGITFDEPHHLVDGYMYWQRQDALFPADTPPLTRITSGWVARVMAIPLRKDTEGWQRQGSFDIGGELIRGLDGPTVRRLFFLTRLTFLIYPLALVWLVWRWGREMFGPTVALVLAACTALEPTILAHGPLIKSDVAAAFGAVLCGYLAWRYWRQPGLGRLAAMGAGLLVAVLAKFTLLAFVPVAVGLALWRGPRLAGVGFLFTVVYLGILTGYQFYEVRKIKAFEYQQMLDEGFTPREVQLVRKVAGKLNWPAQFVKGLRYIGAADRNQGFPAYLLGRKIEYGAPWYFPLAWAIKFPIALQILTLAGLAATVVRLTRREAGAADAFLWLLPVYLLIPALLTHIHIGFRHILPVLPFCIVGGGLALERWGRRRGFRALAAVLVVWLAGASLWIYPHGISYFNEWIGGPRNGWKYLADSNIDWGQNLPELAAYVTRNKIEKIKAFYFGYDIFDHYLPPGRVEDQAAPWDKKWVTTTRLRPAPGIYAVSVNMLLGYFFVADYQEYLAYFKEREPDARAGWSILIYHVK